MTGPPGQTRPPTAGQAGRPPGTGRPIIGSALRNVAIRAVVYQVLIVGTVAVLAWLLVRQALHRLAELGIRSGFGFLDNRAGFDIGERLPIPVLEAGLVHFVVAVAGAAVLVLLVSRWQKARDREGDTWLSALKCALLFGLPALSVFSTGDSIRFEDYTADSRFADALVVGIINTVRVSVLALVLATLTGLVIALMRLSPNWVLRTLGMVYVEVTRNLPLLLHLFFWYFGVIRALPAARDSLAIGQAVFINNRGIYLPDPHAESGAGAFFAMLIAGAVCAWLYAGHARRREEQTGHGPPVLLPCLALLLVPCAIVWGWLGAPLSFTLPVLKGFNFRDALVLTPEFAMMVVALTVYHGAYTAEIIRAGILSVPRGQTEAARSLGLGGHHTFRFVVLPQAIRTILPPMISRYLGLIKSSSLGVAVGYPEIVSIGHSIEFATGQAIELVALTMAFYLTLALTISIWLNWYNARVQLVTTG